MSSLRLAADLRPSLRRAASLPEQRSAAEPAESPHAHFVDAPSEASTSTSSAASLLTASEASLTAPQTPPETDAAPVADERGVWRRAYNVACACLLSVAATLRAWWLALVASLRGGRPSGDAGASDSNAVELPRWLQSPEPSGGLGATNASPSGSSSRSSASSDDTSRPHTPAPPLLAAAVAALGTGFGEFAEAETELARKEAAEHAEQTSTPFSRSGAHWRGDHGVSVETNTAFVERLQGLMRANGRQDVHHAEGDPRLPAQFARDAFRDPAILYMVDGDGVPRSHAVASLISAGADEAERAVALRQVGDWLLALCQGDATLARGVAWGLSQDTLNAVVAAMNETPIFFVRDSWRSPKRPCLPILRDKEARTLVARAVPAAPGVDDAAPAVEIRIDRRLGDLVHLMPQGIGNTDALLALEADLTQSVCFVLRRRGDTIESDALQVRLQGQLQGKPMALRLI